MSKKEREFFLERNLQPLNEAPWLLKKAYLFPYVIVAELVVLFEHQLLEIMNIGNNVAQ